MLILNIVLTVNICQNDKIMLNLVVVLTVILVRVKSTAIKF